MHAQTGSAAEVWATGVYVSWNAEELPSLLDIRPRDFINVFLRAITNKVLDLTAGRLESLL